MMALATRLFLTKKITVIYLAWSLARIAAFKSCLSLASNGELGAAVVEFQRRLEVV